MAAISLVDACIYAGAIDLSAESNEAMLNMEATVLEAKTFGSSWSAPQAGVKSSSVEVKGFYQSTQSGSDAAAWSALTSGPSAEVFTFAPEQTENTAAYLFQAKRTKYETFGAHGELAPVAVSAVGDGGVIRGKLTKEKGNVSATGAIGTGLQLGAVSASQFLYGSFHIFSPGTTITVVLESDDNSGFTTATTRATLGPLTTTGGTWATRTAGSITDTYFRYRVTACTGTFSVGGAIGIGT